MSVEIYGIVKYTRDQNMIAKIKQAKMWTVDAIHMASETSAKDIAR